MKQNRLTRWLVFAAMILSLSAASMAQIAVGISVRIGPPALPVYEQPICPGPGYMWTPGYWAWSDDNGYYWVPGTWVVAPVGLLWTPGYWGWGGGIYAWHAGYWGPHIGFYGGINYGFGYGGVGFGGGEWRGRSFFYNSAVTRVNTVNVTNVYVNKTVIVNNESHVAFNGGTGGIQARATAQEEAYGRETHQAALATQTQHEHAASQNHALFASENHGRPAVAATAKPGEFSGHNVVAAKSAGAPYHAPAMSPREARAPSNATANNAHNNSQSHNNSEPKTTAKNNGGSSKPSTSSIKNSGGNANNNHPANNSRPNESHPQNQQHAKNTPHPAPQHQSAPKPAPQHASAPRPAPHNPPAHQSAPHESEKRPGKK